jgi:hypothetical protein
MGWTTPALGSEFAVAEVVTAAKMNAKLTDNLRYLKGKDGAILLEDRLTLPVTSGGNGMGLRIANGATDIANFQALDLGGLSYIFFSTNRQFDGSATWQQMNTRAAGLLQITQDALTFQTFPAASSTPTERMRIQNTGWAGFGGVIPSGPMHVKGTISSAMLFEYDGVDGTARTVLADGAGDVLYSIVGMFTVRASDGGLSSGNVTANLGLSSGTDLYNPSGAGTNVCRLLTAANGSVTVQRTAGALTYKVALWLLWLSS